MNAETRALIVKTFEKYCTLFAGFPHNDPEYIMTLMGGYLDALNDLGHISNVEVNKAADALEAWVEAQQEAE